MIIDIGITNKENGEIMTMHLEGPWLSTTGKFRGKKKFRSAEQARKAKELEQSWNELQKKYNKPVISKSVAKNTYQLKIPPGRTTKDIPSIDTGHKGAVAGKASQMYTGQNVLGITIVHKSCLQPVFSKQEAIDASTMRR